MLTGATSGVFSWARALLLSFPTLGIDVIGLKAVLVAGTMAAHAAQGSTDGVIEQEGQRLRMSVDRTAPSVGRAVLHSVQRW